MIRTVRFEIRKFASNTLDMGDSARHDLPDFIGIGAQRAGTSWLHMCLREHPSIFFPPTKKEVHFFDENFDKGIDWYEAFFRERQNGEVAGEFTPNYMDNDNAIGRMAEAVPDAKLIVILREPVERAYSAYKLYRSHGQYESTSFREAFDHSDSPLVKFGRYATHLERVYEHYDRKQVLVCFFDDLSANAAAFLANVYAWLGVDGDFQPPSLRQRYNVSASADLQRRLSRLGLGFAINAVKKTALANWLKAKLAARRQANTNKFDDQEHYKAVFREEILKLQDMVHRDLSHWL